MTQRVALLMYACAAVAVAAADPPRLDPAAAGFDPVRRPETLSPAEWIALSKM